MTLPLPLGRGRHARRGRGLCVMELAAAWLGEPHTDRPRGVDPLLAAVARVVNDSVSDAARARLVPLVSDLLGSRLDPLARECVTELVCARALHAGPLSLWAPRLRRAQRAAQRKLTVTGSGPVARTREWQQRRQERTVTLAAASLAFAPLQDYDDEMISLLGDCMVAVGLWSSTEARSGPGRGRHPVSADGREARRQDHGG